MAGPEPTSGPRTPRILIVDDSRKNQQVLEGMLMQEGYCLVTATSGAEALAAVASEPPDLILLDVMMPEMDGYQLAAQIKTNPASKNIPIIIVTALGDREARLRGLSAGAEDFLSQPVDRVELSVRVRNLLRLKAYGDYYDKYSRRLEGVVDSRTADLIDSERLYRETFDAAPVGIVHVGLDGHWLQVNQRLCDLLGYTRAELRGHAVQQLMQSEDVEGEAESRRRMAAGTLDRDVVEEKRYRRRDGSFMWGRVRMSLHRDTEGIAQHFISVIEDVTERRAERAHRKEAGEALRRSEEQYRQIVEATSDGILKTDLAAHLVFVNQRLAEMLGYEPREMVGASVFRFMNAASRKIAIDAVEGRERGLKEVYDLTLSHKDGRQISVNVAGSPVVEGESRFIGSLGIVRDMTERNRLQSQLMVSDRMASVGTLAAGVAHEINNPLSALIANLDYIAESLARTGLAAQPPADPVENQARLHDEILEPLADARDAAQRVRVIVRDLKIFSRSPSAEVRGSVDVRATMESSLRMAWNELRHRARLVKHYSTVPGVEANEARLGQVFLNLIVNAAQAVPEGDAEHNEIGVSARLEGDRVVVEVSDTGAGIPPEIIGRIFDAFFTTKAVGVGTG
ncbi:MAG: PAS domain S-box protein, partial [Gemmatimonadota bacterium]